MTRILNVFRLPLVLRIALVLGAFIPQAAFPQNGHDQGTPAESKPGQTTTSTYAMDKIESVNLVNGNMSVGIPLVTIGGRGSASYTISLSYNSKLCRQSARRRFETPRARVFRQNIFSTIEQRLTIFQCGSLT